MRRGSRRLANETRRGDETGIQERRMSVNKRAFKLAWLIFASTSFGACCADVARAAETLESSGLRIEIFHRGRHRANSSILPGLEVRRRAQKLTVPFKRATKLAANGPQVY